MNQPEMNNEAVADQKSPLSPFDGKKLTIGVASNRDWKGAFVCSMLSLQVMLHRQSNLDYVFDLQFQTSLLPASRQNILDKAIKNGDDWLLFLDDDMMFNPEVISNMAFAMNNLPDTAIIVMNYVSKGAGGLPVAIAKDMHISSFQTIKQHMDDKGEAGSTIYTPLDSCGLGCALINLHKIREYYASLNKEENQIIPMFTVGFDHEKGKYVGEDRNFMRIIKNHFGEKAIVCDHASSLYVGHVGDFVYTELTIDGCNENNEYARIMKG